jgi:hypothetical protein
LTPTAPATGQGNTMKKFITILNTSIITSYGSFTYKPCSLEQAKELVKNGFHSVVGHDSTAQVVSTLLGIDCPANRMQYKQEPGDMALVFKMKARAPEGKILTVAELEEVGYEWGLLERTDISDPVPVGRVAETKAKRLLPALRFIEKAIFATMGIASYFGILFTLWSSTASAGYPGGLTILATIVAGFSIIGLRYMIDRIHYSDCVKY